MKCVDCGKGLGAKNKSSLCRYHYILNYKRMQAFLKAMKGGQND